MYSKHGASISISMLKLYPSVDVHIVCRRIEPTDFDLVAEDVALELDEKDDPGFSNVTTLGEKA